MMLTLLYELFLILSNIFGTILNFFDIKRAQFCKKIYGFAVFRHSNRIFSRVFIFFGILTNSNLPRLRDFTKKSHIFCACEAQRKNV